MTKVKNVLCEKYKNRRESLQSVLADVVPDIKR